MATCRSCKRRIIWIISQATGKAMPCDPDPVRYTPGEGSLNLMTLGGELVHGTPGGDHEGYTSHFATCPNAAQHRRRNGKN